MNIEGNISSGKTKIEEKSAEIARNGTIGDMPWFNQNELAGDDEEMSRDYPIPLYGCGVCAMCAALYRLFGNVITPVQLRNILDRRAEAEDITWLDGEGIDYEPFMKLVSKSFSILCTKVDNVEHALSSLSLGSPLIVGNDANADFNDMFGHRHVHKGHVICFYDTDTNRLNGTSAGDPRKDGRFYAMDSQICGGARVPYTKNEFVTFIENAIARTGRDAGSCYSIMLNRPTAR